MPPLTPDRLPDEEGDFDSMHLLEAVDHLDQIRYHVADDEDLRPPEVRQQLMELHQLIFGWMREGRTIPDEEQVWELIDEIESTVFPIVEHTDQIMTILHALEKMLPEPDDEYEDEDEDV